MINKTNNYPVITQYTVMMASSTGKENINNNNMHKKRKKNPEAWLVMVKSTAQ